MQGEQFILRADKLEKQYAGFQLQPVSFSLPYGMVMGLIGENGAGKTTVLSMLLRLTEPDAGKAHIFGHPMDDSWDVSHNNRIGIVLEYPSYPESLNAIQMEGVLKRLFSAWDSAKYWAYLNRFAIPARKKLKHYSKGMSRIFHLICALSHHPDLLILDELTSGLDPVMRQDVLDILRDFMQTETHGILISTHYLQELESIADHICFLHQGSMVLSEQKDLLLASFTVLHAGKSEIDKIDKPDMIFALEEDFSCRILVNNNEQIRRKYGHFLLEKPSLQDIMMFYCKGEKL